MDVEVFWIGGNDVFVAKFVYYGFDSLRITQLVSHLGKLGMAIPETYLLHLGHGGVPGRIVDGDISFNEMLSRGTGVIPLSQGLGKGPAACCGRDCYGEDTKAGPYWCCCRPRADRPWLQPSFSSA